ncbi:hypothetical protein NX059_009846 [Plenodomus lindquistii]|nr:hypothetical protein NX059_009846 [Plenodomus lindquistii]
MTSSTDTALSRLRQPEDEPIEAENSVKDRFGFPIHTCSYCQRAFEATWRRSIKNEELVHSPKEDSVLRIELGPLHEVEQAVKSNCQFYQCLIREGYPPIKHPYHDSPHLRLEIHNSMDYEGAAFTSYSYTGQPSANVFSCYADESSRLGPHLHLKACPDLDPMSKDNVYFMCTTLDDTLRLRMKPPRTLPPKRLLWLHPSQEYVQLFETSAEYMYRYATLSYCWGGDQRVVTKTETIKSHQNGILVVTLPRTIRDAVRVTVVLGLEYLWVDALCIVQNDENDVAHEIARQADIYRTSTLTLLAGNAVNADSGFLQGQSRVKRHRITVKLPGTEDVMSTLILDLRDDIKVNPVAQRGWILQEFLLSPYVLHFSPDQVMIYCHGRLHYRRGDRRWDLTTTLLRRDWTAGIKVATNAGYRDWNFLVKCYSTMHLSKSSDKLPAISAAAEALGGCFLDTSWLHKSYKAGLWKEHFPSNLLWERALGSNPMSRPAYRAPSWSWASIEGPVDWMQSDEGCEHLVEILSCTTELAYSFAPFGEVSNGQLCVRGPSRSVSSYKTFSLGGDRRLNMHDAEHKIRLSCRLDAMEPDLEVETFKSGVSDLSLLSVLRKDCSCYTDIYGLVLSRRRNESTFRRVGVWGHCLHGASLSWIAAFETTEITIM